MSQSPTGQITAKSCSKCGADFGCGVSSLAGCWCAELPRVGPIGGAELDCMCPTCLSEVIAQLSVKEDDPVHDAAVTPAPLIENEDYYLEGPAMVFTARFLLKRGYCCESGCRHCPY